jgi:hypothetical protein
MAFFTKTNGMYVRSNFFVNFVGFWTKSQFFFAQYFGENSFKNHNVGPCWPASGISQMRPVRHVPT